VILRVAKQLFLPIAAAFLIYFAWQSREILVDIIRSAKALNIIFAVLIWLMMNALSALFSMLVFRARKLPLSYKTAFKIHVRNLPARYVPGGVWHTVGRIGDLRDLGIGQRDISIFVFLENVLAICTALMIGGSLVASYRGFDAWGQIAALSALGAAVCLFLSPYLLSLRVVRDGTPFPTQSFIAGTLVTAASWFIAASAFVIYLSAFPALSIQMSPLETAGSYLFSWGVGFISIFAPQGIGVFEVVAADLMRGTGSITSVAALLAGFRLIILCADALAWSALQIFRK